MGWCPLTPGPNAEDGTTACVVDGGVSSSERLFGLIGPIEAHGDLPGFPRGPFATLRQASSAAWSRQHSKRLTRSGSTASALMQKSRQPSYDLARSTMSLKAHCAVPLLGVGAGVAGYDDHEDFSFL